MTKLKTLLLPILLLLFMAAPMKAQVASQDTEKKAQEVTSRLVQRLDLNQEQINKITEIHADYLQHLQKMKQSAMNKEEKATAVKRLIKKEDKKMQEVLTEAQFEKYVQLRNTQMKKYLARKKEKARE